MKRLTQLVGSLFLQCDAGFSLLEILVSMVIAFMLVVVTSAWIVALYGRVQHFQNSLEDSAMFAAIARTMEQDAHASNGAQFLYGNLVLNQMSGLKFTYYVNANRQLIRYQSSGGVAVIGSRVKRVVETIHGQYLQICVTLSDGTSMVIGASFGED